MALTQAATHTRLARAQTQLPVEVFLPGPELCTAATWAEPVCDGVTATL